MSNIKKYVNFSTHNKLIKLVVVNIIILCVIPFISCTIDENGNSLDSSSEYHRKHFILPSADDENSDEEMNSNEDQYYKSDEETDLDEPQLYAAYHETYITEDAAKKFRHKINSNKKPYTRKDYDDLLEDIILKPIHEPNTNKNVPDIYDKKYFDYLPAEETNLDTPFDTSLNKITNNNKDYEQQSIEIGIEEFLNENNGLNDGDDDEIEQETEILPDTQHLSDQYSIVNKFQQINNRRYKRDIQLEDGNKLGNEKPINNKKRHAIWGHQIQYLTQAPYQPLSYFVPREIPISINPLLYTNTEYKSEYFNPNNPWNTGFYGSSNLNNYNLPVADTPPTGYYYIRPTYEIFYPRIYHNVGTPPNNPLKHRVPYIPAPVVNTNCHHNIKHNEKENPKETTVAPPLRDPAETSDNFNLSNRFGEDDDTTKKPFQHALTDDDRPIWGVVETNRQPAIFSSNSVINKAVTETSTKRPTPSLIHDREFLNSLDNTNKQPSNVIGINRQGIQLTTTRRPAFSNDRNFQNSPTNERFPSRIPATTNPFGTNRQASNDGGSFGTREFGGSSENGPVWNTFDNNLQNSIQSPSNQPNYNNQNQIPTQTSQLAKCVWGVINCCSRSNEVIRYACFEQLGCHGAFWDLNPCKNDVIDAAIGEADKFFN